MPFMDVIEPHKRSQPQPKVTVLRALIFCWDHLNEPYGIKDLNSKFLYANPAYKALLGVSESFNIEGLSEAEFPSNLSIFSSEIQNHERLVEKENTSKSSLVVCSCGKEKRIIVFEKMAFYNEKGELSGTLCHGRNANFFSINFYLNSIKIGIPGKLFTNREWDIVFLLNQGMKPKDIAHRLDLAYKSVRNKISEILQKINVKNTAELVVLCQKNGWHIYVPDKFYPFGYVLLENG